jgi:cobalt-zinc-cadmium efflux system protein
LSGHDHDHAVAVTTHRGRILLVLVLTSTVLVVEVIGAIITGSLALLADAGHMLTDVAGLVMALITATLMTRPASSTRTWGWRRAEILGATAQAAALFAVGVFVLVEGVRRLFEPPDVASGLMVVFGLVGLVANAVGILILIGNRNANMNMRAAFLEVLNDTLGSVAVIVAAVTIALTGWEQADALASILIALLILPRAFRLLREAVDILLEKTPADLDLDEVRRHILDLPHVQEVHDLHASQIATGLPVLSAHVIVDDECFTDGHAARLLTDLQDCVATHFPVSIEHSTFQIEPAGHRTTEHTLHP